MSADRPGAAALAAQGIDSEAEEQKVGGGRWGRRPVERGVETEVGATPQELGGLVPVREETGVSDVPESLREDVEEESAEQCGVLS